jgi:hypothetical protein
MANGETTLEAFLFEQWPEAIALRDAVGELEDSLTARLTSVAERVSPWCEEHGFRCLPCHRRYAAINVAKPSWMDSQDTPRVYISVAALFPAGFRKVVDPHPSIWVYSYGLAKQEQGPFRDALSRRLVDRPGNWINDDCKKIGPAGHYVTSHGDPERIALARSEELLEAFVREQLALALTVVGDVDSALAEV